jgi:hypothetical protein
MTRTALRVVGARAEPWVANAGRLDAAHGALRAPLDHVATSWLAGVALLLGLAMSPLLPRALARRLWPRPVA